MKVLTVTILTVFFFLVAMVTPLEGFCYSGFLISSSDHSKPAYCNGPNGKINVGESVRHGCVDCSCSEGYGLSCCGVGYAAGVMHFPGCSMQTLDNCCFQFVSDDDPTKICLKKRCPRPHNNIVH